MIELPPHIERSGPVPIYQQIRDWLNEQIISGTWPEHYKLDSEVDLAAALQVSLGTVRRAIAILLDEGKLIQIHGRGTFVSSSYLEQPLAERLTTFSENLLSRHIPYETEVLEQSVIQPPQHIASLLSLPPYTGVLNLRRRRFVGGKPITVLHNFVALNRCPGIEALDFTRYRLFEALETVLKVPLDWAQRSFEAQVANEETAHLLDIVPGSPVLYMEQLLYVKGGKPVELSNLWFRGDRFRISATVSRDHSADFTRGTYGLVMA